MPKSRKRRTHRRHGSSGCRPKAPSVDELEPYVEIMLRADAAEHRGDAWGALKALDERPIGPDGRPFWRPERVTRLAQLTHLEGLLPPWVHSRWILAQALQQGGEAARLRTLRALDVTVAARGGVGALPGIDHVDARAKVVDSDWVFRQLALYELGGLAAFLRTAPADLVSGADRIGEWAATPMSGLRLVARDSRTISWEDLVTGEPRSVENIGAAALAMLGECVVGRLVPVSTRSGWMFESAPLVVEESVARAVAGSPGNWLAAVKDGLRSDRAPMSQVGFDFPMLTDVPRAVWMHVLFEGRSLATSSEPRGVARAVMDCAEAALSEAAPRPRRDEVELWPCLFAAILDPFALSGFGDALKDSDLPTLVSLADRLPGPAAAVCDNLRDRLAAREPDCA